MLFRANKLKPTESEQTQESGGDEMHNHLAAITFEIGKKNDKRPMLVRYFADIFNIIDGTQPDRYLYPSK